MTLDEKRLEGLARTVPDERDVRRALEKASLGKGLGLEEAACLLGAEGPELAAEITRTAAGVKRKVFGDRVVLFAPLYLSSYCTNGCLYCGFRSGNMDVVRRALTPEEAVGEARALEAMGFKRVLLVTGEDPRYSLDYITDCVRAVYKNTGMRIVHVNAPPMDTEGLRELKASGVGVYQSFQETYHRPTYARMHPSGRKKDYGYRLDVMDRALAAGFNDVGIGPLLGLYDFKFETLATIAHSLHLYEAFGTHAHTISVPRLRSASSGLAGVPAEVTDPELKRITSVLRLSVPSAGVVVSTRESAEMRAALLEAGASQISAASRTNPGGYTHAEEKTLEQFSTNDTRPLAEVMASVASAGKLPSLCTTCYRVGRTGGAFTEKAVAGQMEPLCQANAVLTLKEYLAEHSNNGNAKALEKALEEGTQGVADPELKKALLEKLKRIEEGERDLFF